MTTDDEKTTVEEAEQNTEQEMKAVEHIARRLREDEPKAIEGVRRIVTMLGADPALVILDEALEADAKGGMMTDDGKRRRTLGGVFFKMAKNKMTQEQRSKLFVPPWWPKDAPPEIPQYDWAERIEDIHQFKGPDRGFAEMEVRITGNPAKIIDRGSAILLVMVDTPPTTFPKGLPQLPANKQPVCLAIVIKKHWEEIESKIAEGFRVSLTGYPIYDDKLKQITILTRVCKAVKPRKPKPPKEDASAEPKAESEQSAEKSEEPSEETIEVVAEVSEEVTAEVAAEEAVAEVSEEVTEEVTAEVVAEESVAEVSEEETTVEVVEESPAEESNPDEPAEEVDSEPPAEEPPVEESAEEETAED